MILGSDCTITLGVVTGFLQHGTQIGLVYFDGDVDLSAPETTTSGILDAMGMAHLLGRGADPLRRIAGQLPLLPGDRISLFGYDSSELSEAEAAFLDQHAVARWPADRIRGRSAAAAAEALAAIAARSDGVLVHFDLDAVDSTDFPLAHFPHFNVGLSLADALSALDVFCASASFSGLVITEINPHHDPDGAMANRLVEGLVDALSGQPHPARSDRV